MKACLISDILSVIGKKWMAHIIATFYQEKELTFGNLGRAFPHITSRLLSQRLKELQAFHLIEKIDGPERIYRITPQLISLSQTL